MKKFLVAISATLALAIAVLAGQTAHAAWDPFGQACLNGKEKTSICQDRNQTQDPDGENSLYGKNGILAKAVTILDIIIGLVAVIMIIIGGIKFVTSQGDSNNINSARNTVIYALVGIVIAVSGQVIVKFVLNRL